MLVLNVTGSQNLSKLQPADPPNHCRASHGSGGAPKARGHFSECYALPGLRAVLRPCNQRAGSIAVTHRASAGAGRGRRPLLQVQGTAGSQGFAKPLQPSIVHRGPTAAAGRQPPLYGHFRKCRHLKVQVYKRRHSHGLSTLPESATTSLICHGPKEASNQGVRSPEGKE